MCDVKTTPPMGYSSLLCKSRRRDSALRLSARHMAHCGLFGLYVPSTSGQAQGTVPTAGTDQAVSTAGPSG
jgi:hypothetical protein